MARVPPEGWDPPGQTGGGCGRGTRAWPRKLVVDAAAAPLMIREMGIKATVTFPPPAVQLADLKADGATWAEQG